jgi:hypothetical protein
LREAEFSFSGNPQIFFLYFPVFRLIIQHPATKHVPSTKMTRFLFRVSPGRPLR